MNDKVQPTPPLQESERDRYNFDAGYESGWAQRNTELLDAVESGLESAIDSLRTLVTEMRAA